jgi:hypothetical protein
MEAIGLWAAIIVHLVIVEWLIIKPRGRDRAGKSRVIAARPKISVPSATTSPGT